jgi:hypothetical protein
MPLRMVSRSDSAENRCGSHESTAMFAITRGPSRKPACAATNSSVPSLISAMMTKAFPTCRPASDQSPATRSSRTAFMVLPSTGRHCHRR